MKPSILLLVLVFCMTFVGRSQRASVPEPAQGNSANIDFTQGKVMLGGGATSRTSVSYDSRLGTTTIRENLQALQEIVPLCAGTETVDVKKEIPVEGNSAPVLLQPYFSMIHESRSYGYAWYLNCNWSTFQNLLTTLGNQGFRIENIDTYGRYVFDYAGTWTQDGRGWAWVLNYSNVNSFMSVLNNWPIGTTRYRPIDFAMNVSGSVILYGAVAVADQLGFGWIFNEGNPNNFISWINSQYSSGRRLVEVGFYRDVNGNLACSGISKDAGFAQQVAINLSYANFITLNTQYLNQGYRLVDYDRYFVAGTLYYAGLWNNDGVGYAYALDYNSLTTFQGIVANYISQGFKPTVIDIHDCDWEVSVADETRPAGFSLRQNFPNPFNPSTTIQYDLPRKCFATLKVYDILGGEIATLVDEEKAPGHYDLHWKPGNLASGVYLYKLQAGDFIQSRKLILLK